ncbi:hypothetical protein [Kordia sp.]|uniref:hypothetical protein n=1 Tax=Kordia sp. TaxID=1965332 RepID=UPI003B59E2E4
MNIKEIFTKLTGYVLIGTLVLSISFLVVGIKSSPINWIFISIGIVIFAPFGIYLLYTKHTLTKENDRIYNAHVRKLKTNGSRVIVILNEAEINEKKHIQTKTVVSGEAAALNEISGYGAHNETQITHTYCEVTFKVSYAQKTLFLKQTIDKDETSVRMYFYMQKETVAYLDPYDPEYYYIDLEFIEN